jgi:hypothetical protein
MLRKLSVLSNGSKNMNIFSPLLVVLLDRRYYKIVGLKIKTKGIFLGFRFQGLGIRFWLAYSPTLGDVIYNQKKTWKL